MKQIIAAVILVLCLTGCVSGDTVPETSAFQTETVPTATAAPTLSDKEQTQPTAFQQETQQPTSEADYDDTIPSQVIVQPQPDEEDFVKVVSYIPDIVVDLRYSTDLNFTNQQIYRFTDAWLRYGTVQKLKSVQEELKQSGLYLKIWDGFRPPSAQFKLWDVCPDPTYVSDPNNGFSSHSRGNTVDATLVYADGTELTMPTGFDDFTKLADRDYSDCSEEAATNARRLEDIMVKHGFKPYSGEWWHFSDTQSYPVDQEFEPAAPIMYYADCNEFISLRTKPDTAADVITKIPAGEQFRVVAGYGAFAVVEYQNLFGYVLRDYTQLVS